MKKFLFLLGMMVMSIIPITNKNIKEVQADTSIDGYRIIYHSEPIGPITPKSKVEIKGSISCLRGNTRSHLRLKYELFTNAEYEGKKNYKEDYIDEEFTYDKGEVRPYSFIIEDDKEYAENGIKVRLGVYWLTKNKYISYIENTIYSKREEVISIDDIPGKVIYDNTFTLEENEGIYKESFDFTSFSHILELDSYFRLDLSSFSFTYDYVNHFSYEEAYLSFVDKEGLFPHIKEVEGRKRIPLILTQKKKEITFSFVSLYINPNTFDLSSTSLEGYKETKYFYLPKNKQEKLQGYTFHINVIKMGTNFITFDYPFTINSSSLLLGPCNEASYCVVGGVR